MSVAPDLTGIYWLGGSPCAGKSSAAALLCERHPLGYFKCDDYFEAHLLRGAEAKLPVSSQLLGAAPDFIFLRTQEQNLQLTIGIYREQLSFISRDLAPVPRPVLVEGAALLPEVLARWGVLPERCFYLIPTESFQREHYAQRPWARQRVARTSNPKQAYENWMQRDVAFANHIERTAKEARYTTLRVDGSLDLKSTVSRVEEHFGLVERKPAPFVGWLS